MTATRKAGFAFLFVATLSLLAVIFPHRVASGPYPRDLGYGFLFVSPDRFYYNDWRQSLMIIAAVWLTGIAGGASWILFGIGKAAAAPTGKPVAPAPAPSAPLAPSNTPVPRVKTSEKGPSKISKADFYFGGLGVFAICVVVWTIISGHH